MGSFHIINNQLFYENSHIKWMEEDQENKKSKIIIIIKINLSGPLGEDQLYLFYCIKVVSTFHLSKVGNIRLTNLQK